MHTGSANGQTILRSGKMRFGEVAAQLISNYSYSRDNTIHR